MELPPMSDKIAAIMAKLEKGEKKREVANREVEEKPPTNLEEFMKVENLDEWPQRLTSEGPMDIQDERLLLGSKEDIVELLRDAAPLGVEKLNAVQQRLEALEDTLNYYASQIVAEDKRESRLQDRLFYSPSRTFMTEVSGSDAVKSHHSSKGHKSLADKFNMKSEQISGLISAAEREGVRQDLISDFVDSLMETRKKSLEYCTFPGFRHGELIELPGQLESPPILHRVTKAQDFNPGFKKFWKKIFLSEASVAVMQDTFWWFFLEKFDTNKPIDKNLLYDRIADSYVALFTSINGDVKDKFLMEYPNCLAQAVFSAYWEAFPESRNKFSDQLRQELLNTISEWTTGVKPVPGTFKSWKMRRLQSKPLKGMEKENSKTAEQMMQAAALNKELNYSLDIESFAKMVDKMGTEQVMYGLTPLGMSRDVTQMTNSPSQGPTVISQSRLATAGTSRGKPTESHQIGPGPTYERVKFNTQGRSPLISHYLHLRKLKDLEQPGKRVRRTEIVKVPSPGPTYRQLIQNTLAMTDALSKEYQRICDETDAEIYELERRQATTNREFNKLTKELMFTKNPVDLKILSDKIIGLRKPMPSKDRDRETPLLQDDKGHHPAIHVTSDSEEEVDVRFDEDD
ncbi:protein FAM227B-like isoform X2 [Mya arenaria]|uniref:protein FAM227B-like isoform X2 n=1 Tax=Mya arenaria TaxID=6604 RepID=UPI0022E054C3|nr:protein FAM227B-like isoform X2 [Mya arenaria]